MRVRVQRWGNSLAVRVPSAFGRELKLHPESAVDLTLDEGRLILTPAPDPDTPSLAELVAEITPRNRHSEQWPEPAAGRETW